MTVGYSLDITNEIATLTLDLEGEKVNKLSTPVMESLLATFEDLKQKPLKALILKSAKPGIFIAGADIKEIENITEVDEAIAKTHQGQHVIDTLESLPFPTIAAIHGACLGGGLELVLGCDYRIATTDSKTILGLPEVNLGIIPGFGGTQRLPRLIGLAKGLELIVSGRPVKGPKAEKIKLVDKAVPVEFLEEHIEAFVQTILTKKGAASVRKKRSKRPFIIKVLEGTMVGRSIIYSKTHKTVLEKTKGHYPAPITAIKAVKYGFKKSLKKGLKRERELFSTLVSTPVCKNLIQLFYTQEALKKYTGVKEGAPKPIANTGVLGAGLMGGGIAWLLSSGKKDVRLKDLNWDAISLGLKQAYKVYKSLMKRRKYTPSEVSVNMHRISGTLDYSGFEKTDLVIEAILENIDIKKSVFKELEPLIPKDAIIASNTSALSITEMATSLKYPERFVGMHFFSPVNRMPLVEVIPGEKTSPDTIASIVELSKKLKKTPIVVQNCPGFLVNRVLIPYVVEAIYALCDGDSILSIDKKIEEFGMPIGPLALGDEVGLDVGFKVAQHLEQGYSDRMRVPEIFKIIYEDDTLRGKKTGKGFYTHTGKTKVANTQMISLIKAHTKPTPGADPKDTVKRLIYLMINEATRCLDEGVVESPELCDMAMIMGTGFPPFRGGLCKYADQLGIQNIVADLTRFSKQYSPRFEPCEALKKMAENNDTFYKKQT